MTGGREEAEDRREMEGLRADAVARLSLSSSSPEPPSAAAAARGGDRPSPSPSSSAAASRRAMAAEGVFECKTCSRRFASFQALGGHRTSHTRLQARMLSDPAGGAAAAAAGGERDIRARVHECGVCGLLFPMGQALGGHMRRHRGEAAPAPAASHDDGAARPEHQEAMPDLNLPPLEDGDDGQDQQQPAVNRSSEPQLLNLLV